MQLASVVFASLPPEMDFHLSAARAGATSLMSLDEMHF
jgi:hypothetical protein